MLSSKNPNELNVKKETSINLNVVENEGIEEEPLSIRIIRQ